MTALPSLAEFLEFFLGPGVLRIGFEDLAEARGKPGTETSIPDFFHQAPPRGSF